MPDSKYYGERIMDKHFNLEAEKREHDAMVTEEMIGRHTWDHGYCEEFSRISFVDDNDLEASFAYALKNRSASYIWRHIVCHFSFNDIWLAHKCCHASIRDKAFTNTAVRPVIIACVRYSNPRLTIRQFIANDMWDTKPVMALHSVEFALGKFLSYGGKKSKPFSMDKLLIDVIKESILG